MAEKQVPLSIIIRTVDKATAGIQHINEKLDALTRPTREFGKALKELGEKSGFNRLSEAFGEVGKASKETFIKLLEGAAIIGETTHLVLEMVEGFASLNDAAERTGTSVDALAGLRYAASKSGADIEKLDQGLQTFVVNLGGVKAGTGKLTKFLGEVAPTMLRQLKATRTTEEALGILAAGMEKLTNKSKQLKFAQEALGDASLAALFHRGPAGIKELTDAYAKLAGPQQEAAERAAKVDDALKDLHASTEGVKAALVTGLSPALSEIINKLAQWLSGHREDVERWAADLGTKLPGAVQDLVAWTGRAYDKVTSFVEAIGGWKVAAGALAAVMTSDLIVALVALGGALTTTPVGIVITGLAAIAAGIAVVTKETRAFSSFVDEQAAKAKKLKYEPTDEELAAEGMRNTREQARREAYSRVTGKSMDDIAYEASYTPSWEMNQLYDEAMRHEQVQNRIAHQLPPLLGNSAYPQAGPRDRDQAKITIDIKGAPAGTRATIDPSSTANVDLSVGHQMAGGY